MPGIVPKERKQYFIRLEKGGVMEVNREVYLCWYAGDRQERYQIERDRKNGVISLNGLADVCCEEGSFLGELISSPEDAVDVQVMKNIISEKLHQAIRRLKPEERRLIYALFFEDVGIRSYARQMGVTHRTVQKWRDGVLQNLRAEMERNGLDFDSVF